MNFNFSSNNKPLSTYSLAGLTDIVLLLLVFFLLTSNFIPQFGIQVNLPQAETSAPMDDQYVSVAITADGQYYVNQNLIPREQLADALREAKGIEPLLSCAPTKKRPWRNSHSWRTSRAHWTSACSWLRNAVVRNLPVFRP